MIKSDSNSTIGNLDYQQNESVLTLIEKQTLQSPDAIALVYQNKSLTYQELSDKASQLAHYIKKKGIPANTLIAICMNNCLEV